ncbi:DNA polymerase subunit gamma-2, mitochondrial [Trachymyrmex septentrionalis]|uniref:DNA polymerase subunit gamma-2, mitochondrial n=1 Tax=Trachymyrmex septentrionalis TaxID=34720 RepID=A0A195FEE8_9HYME|nr:DNA polymerase subunit gamma-2, mitochondrial [Trachymyrmex septentrionalis]
MAMLRQVKPAYRLFDEGVVFLLRGNAVPSFSTFNSSTVFARQQQQQKSESNNKVKENNNNSKLGGDKRPSIDEATIRRLERLALVGFEFKQSKRVLEEAIAFAERLRTVHIDETVRPMYSTLENDCIHLRDDVVQHDVDRREILRNAAVLEEEYFVAPLTTSKEKEKAVLKTVGSHFLSLSERMFVYGSQGKLMLKNLEEHWFSHCVTMPHYNVFPCDTIADTLQQLRSNSMDMLPFALATLGTSSKSVWNESLLSVGKVPSHRIAKINVFVDASDSKDLLHKKQRERKVWWRKLAQHPSRFVLAEAKKTRNLDVTEIEAQFPFGNIIVETITHYPGVRKLYPQTENNKDNVMDVHMIEHIASMDWGCLALFCDSHMLNKSTRAYIHPKLCPYKITFHIGKQENETDSDIEDLNRFVLYLNNMLRTRGISTILTNTEQIVEMCLIPYVVSVDKTSLKNGVVHVKNRSTTLSEAVHITDLVKYISLRSS